MILSPTGEWFRCDDSFALYAYGRRTIGMVWLDTEKKDYIEDSDKDKNDNDNEFVTFDDGKGSKIYHCIPVREFMDGNGITHELVNFPVKQYKNGRRRAITKKCDTCKKLTTFFVKHVWNHIVIHYQTNIQENVSPTTSQIALAIVTQMYDLNILNLYTISLHLSWINLIFILSYI